MCVLARSGETLHPSDEPHLTGLTAGTVTRSADADHDAQILCGKACHSISAMISSDVCGWWSVPRRRKLCSPLFWSKRTVAIRELARAVMAPTVMGDAAVSTALACWTRRRTTSPGCAKFGG